MQNMSLQYSEEEKEYNNHNNPMDDCSPIELFQNTLPYDGTVELIGLVDEESMPITFENAYRTETVFKGVLTNYDWRVQITVWGKEDIDTVKPLFKLNNILHIDGAFSQERNVEYSLGNVSIDLTYKSNTVIKLHNTIIPKITPHNKINYKQVNFEDMLSHKFINIKAYLKSEFSMDVKKGIQTFIGSVCWKQYRMEIRSKDPEVLGKYKSKSFINICGKINEESIPYIYIESTKDIKLLTGNISDADLRRATYLLPQKRKNDSMDINKEKCLKVVSNDE